MYVYVRRRVLYYKRSKGPYMLDICYKVLLIIVKRRKLTWYGHVIRSKGLAKLILQRHFKGKRRSSSSSNSSSSSSNIL